MLAAPGVDDGRPFGDALSALGLEGWLRWGLDFQGFRQPVLDGEAGGPQAGIQERAGLADGRWPPEASTGGGHSATAFSAVALEGWLRWGARFPGIEAARPRWRAAGGPSGALGAGGLGRRALAAPDVDGGRPFGDRVQCRRLGRLAARGSRFRGIEAARPRWRAAGGPSGDPGAGGLARRLLAAPVAIGQPRPHSTHLQSRCGSRSICH